MCKLPDIAARKAKNNNASQRAAVHVHQRNAHRPHVQRRVAPFKLALHRGVPLRQTQIVQPVDAHLHPARLVVARSVLAHLQVALQSLVRLKSVHPSPE